MFEDFDTMDMYGFLDYLEESTSFIGNEIDFVSLEESYGIYEDLDGNLCIENEVIYEAMDNYGLTEDEAFIAIMEAYEEDLLLEWNPRTNQSIRSQAAQQRNENIKNKEEEERQREEQYQNNLTRTKELSGKTQHELDMIGKENSATYQHMNDVEARYQKEAKIAATDSKSKQKRNSRLGAAGGAVVAAGGVLAANKIYKAHKAKKEAEARRNRGLRGKLRRLREDEDILFVNESLDFLMENFNLTEIEALSIIIENELLSEGKFNPRSGKSKRQQAMEQRQQNKPIEQVQQQRVEAAQQAKASAPKFNNGNQAILDKYGKYYDAQNKADQAQKMYDDAVALRQQNREKNEQKIGAVHGHYQAQAAKDAEGYKKQERKSGLKGAAIGVAGGAALAGGVLAYKHHKAKKEAEARRNRGLRGKLRRLREDEQFMLEESYGIFENEYGELFIENEMINYVMDAYDLYEEDAIDVIMESFEEELDELLTEGVKEYIKDKRKKRSHKKVVKAVKKYVNTGDYKGIKPALERYVKDREDD